MSNDTTEQNRGPIAVDLTDDAERDRTTSGRVPHGNYKLRIIDEPEFSLSKVKTDPKTGLQKGGNPMLCFPLEIVSPTEAVAGDQTYHVGGIKFRTWAVFTFNKEGRETNRQLADLHKATGLTTRFFRDADTGLPTNDEGIPLKYTGLEFDGRVDSEEYKQKGDDGMVLTNPLTGEELTGYQYSLKQIYVP